MSAQTIDTSTPKMPSAWEPVAAVAILLLAVGAILLNAGCTYTHMQTVDGGGYKLHRVSLLQKVDVPQVTVLPDGSVSLDNYKNDGGGEAFASAVAKAYEMGKKAAVTAAK